MRARVAAAMLYLAAAVGQGLAASPAPTVASDEAYIGCVHTQLRACMISLGTVFWYDMTRVTAQIAQRNELDVNGRTAHRRLSFDMKLPLHVEQIGITLTLASPSPNDEVVKIEIGLPNDPESAHTQSEYDRLVLYDVVAAVLGNRCPALDKLTLYRFFENTIKPHEVVKTEVYHEHSVIQTKQTTDTAKLPFCNAMFSLHRSQAWYGAPDAQTRPLPRPGLSDTTITVE